MTSIENAEGRLATDVGVASLQKSRKDWWHFIMGPGGTLLPEEEACHKSHHFGGRVKGGLDYILRNLPPGTKGNPHSTHPVKSSS